MFKKVEFINEKRWKSSDLRINSNIRRLILGQLLRELLDCAPEKAQAKLSGLGATSGRQMIN